MLGSELVVILCTAVLLCSLAARRWGLPAPVLLLACGILLGLIPALAEVELPPEAVLFLFLPVLLYWESISTSLREVRSNLRGIVLMGTLLVIVTAWAVAAAAHALGLPWGPAWVLGAAIAPTDATAVGALARVLPNRYVTVLRAESLINDGTALVVYGVAVAATARTEVLDAADVSGRFLLAYAGGIAAGALTAWAGVHVRRWIQDPLLSNVVTILSPFTAFVLAESVEASGVLAVVVAGLAMGRLGPRVVQAGTRRQMTAFWSLATFLLNGALFVLVGLELPRAISELTRGELFRGLVLVGVVTVVIVAVRLAYLFGTTYLIRLLDRRESQRARRISNRARVVSGLAGFRGAVSLAAALATPRSTAAGTPFPDRDLIIFVAAGVIVVTLVLQAPLLPAVARWARLPQDTEARTEELRFAQASAINDALEAMPRLASELGTDQQVVDELVTEYNQRLGVLRALANETDADDDGAARALTRAGQYRELGLALIARKRNTLIRLRDERRIDDTVLLQLQARLDLEEVRLAAPHDAADEE
ncbi:Na+/H+ antiporter [Arthrobacter sunyaminii]|uniref:Na+/H+ antiporter n=1 Tax=Arthrobacter sunyaminii TaxID=2816859 RepID=A0A975S8J1_9MICC|nr:Na+/H+ antiporter [Arthrobacter sunyaminii]MBO0907016.1 Na+/H+ antiporter [Arthrobacter sunyaminii]QWQ37759.1 Na+/H+ antiporter [Arthrobacter sunyaminii]